MNTQALQQYRAEIIAEHQTILQALDLVIRTLNPAAPALGIPPSGGPPPRRRGFPAVADLDPTRKPDRLKAGLRTEPDTIPLDLSEIFAGFNGAPFDCKSVTEAIRAKGLPEPPWQELRQALGRMGLQGKLLVHTKGSQGRLAQYTLPPEVET